MNMNQLVDLAYDSFNSKKYDESLEVLSNVDDVLEVERLSDKEKDAIRVSLLKDRKSVV